jgi:spore photoproduct lyase
MTAAEFHPDLIFFEDEALSYPLGDKLYQLFLGRGMNVRRTGSHNRITGLPGDNPREKFFKAKRTLVVGVRRGLDFETCRPSAHYQLPLVTGCPGLCRYCYLLTNLGRRPYIRIYANQDEILARAGEYLAQQGPEVTVFEGAANSDPLAVEEFSGAMALAIEFFAGHPGGRFRFVTKFASVEPLLHLDHQGATRIRFSVNSEQVIQKFEQATSPLAARLDAAAKVAAAGYPLGFMIAPIITGEGWEDQYRQLLEKLHPFTSIRNLSFELITHRFTARAKKVICELFPQHGLPLEESERTFKWGQFGYGKYVYPKNSKQKIEAWFRSSLGERFPLASIDYFV